MVGGLPGRLHALLRKKSRLPRKPDPAGEAGQGRPIRQPLRSLNGMDSDSLIRSEATCNA